VTTVGSVEDARIALLRAYFRLSDQGSPQVLDLFHEDVEFYFPKFGFGVGRQAFVEFIKGFEGTLEFILHDYDTLAFIAAGDQVVVEGTSRGKLSGHSWVAGESAGGRFCNVFTFRGDRISKLHVYLDPDYTGLDTPRFRWGRDRRW
jgi:ketosteroid isomerase-like protein